MTSKWQKRAVGVIMVGAYGWVVIDGAKCIDDGPRNPACDAYAVAVSTATGSLGASYVVSQNMITGDAITAPKPDQRPAFEHLPPWLLD